MPSSSTLSVVEASPATWGDARKLVEKVRAGARAWLELGEVLEALREQYLGEGHGGDRRSKTARDQAPHGAALEKGWQAKVREELGISDDTARRWMLDAKRHDQLIRITDGTVQQVDGQRVTDEVRERAQSALSALEADPSARPARLWAGLWGGAATKGKQRAAVDHARNIARGLTALQTSLPHWQTITPEQRAALERGWELIRDLLPPTFAR
jgi:hypothetical protein